eukprot:6198027-Pleurochrysis_carterae.AAC.1
MRHSQPTCATPCAPGPSAHLKSRLTAMPDKYGAPTRRAAPRRLLPGHARGRSGTSTGTAHARHDRPFSTHGEPSVLLFLTAHSCPPPVFFPSSVHTYKMGLTLFVR